MKETARSRIIESLTNTNQGLASVDVDELDIGNQRHALLPIGNLRAHVFAENIVRADLALGVQDRTGRAVEDEGLVRLSRGPVDVALVVGGQHRDGASLVQVVALAVGSCDEGQYIRFPLCSHLNRQDSKTLERKKNRLTIYRNPLGLTVLSHGSLAPLDGTGVDAARLEAGCTALEGAPVGLRVRASLDGMAALGFLVARVGGGEGCQSQHDCCGEIHGVLSLAGVDG